MIATADNPNIPDWLKDNILKKCPAVGCGFTMIDNDNLTQRMCVNPFCPGHMAHRVDKLAKRFGVKNFGPSTATAVINKYGFKSHLEIIPLWYKERPEAFVWEIGEMAMIPGFNKRWRDFAGKAHSMSEVINNPDTPYEVVCGKRFLLEAEKYFKVKEPLEGKVIKIMVTGSINGFANRADFLRKVNSAYGEFIQLVDVGKRKTEVDYLVKEEYTTDHDKSEVARRCGIPIITPGELVVKIHKYAEYHKIIEAPEALSVGTGEGY